MKLNEYQDQAASTAIFPGDGCFWGLAYCALKLTGEAGEVSEKIGKMIRDTKDLDPMDDIASSIEDEKKFLLVKELGDVMWYIANIARLLGYTLQEVAEINTAKLRDRQVRGVLQGSGDTR